MIKTVKIMVLSLCFLFVFTGCDRPDTAKDADAIKDTNEERYFGEIYKVSADLLAFSCSHVRGDTSLEGGSDGYSYKVIVTKDDWLIYQVYQSTTSDNGRTCLYALDCSDVIFKEMKDCVDREDCQQLYERCDNAIQNKDYEIVTNGMLDDDSRNDDGTYKWWSDYNERVGEVVLKLNIR